MKISSDEILKHSKVKNYKDKLKKLIGILNKQFKNKQYE